MQKTMENHHVSWENPLFLWPFSIAMLVYQRVHMHCKSVNPRIVLWYYGIHIFDGSIINPHDHYVGMIPN